jgi:hypothetical protein
MRKVGSLKYKTNIINPWTKSAQSASIPCIRNNVLSAIAELRKQTDLPFLLTEKQPFRTGRTVVFVRIVESKDKKSRPISMKLPGFLTRGIWECGFPDAFRAGTCPRQCENGASPSSAPQKRQRRSGLGVNPGPKAGVFA